MIYLTQLFVPGSVESPLLCFLLLFIHILCDNNPAAFTLKTKLWYY